MPTSIFKKVKSNLAQNKITSIVMGLLPNGRLEGNIYKPINPTRSDTKPGSFVIHLTNGCFWRDFATGEKGGDIISLYSYVKGISQYEAAKELEGFCDTDINYTGSAISQQPKGDFQKCAKRIWISSQSATGTLVARYLKSRGYNAEIPDSIRYSPDLKHSKNNGHFPAMVAGITLSPSEEIVAIHRTFLSPCGLKKADIKPNKMMLGSVKGGSVKLGSVDGNSLAIAEGIETALSFQYATGIPTWAALSANFMECIIIPSSKQVPNIIIVADNDEPGIKSANRLARRLRAENYCVRIVMPEQAGWDFNDVIMRGKNDY